MWTVETLNRAVDDEIADLPKDIQAAFLRLAERIQAIGLERIGMPYLRHLEGKLWEMRLSGRDGIARLLYVTAANRRLIVLHAFAKKTQRAPRAAIELALRRAQEIEM